MDLMAKLNRMAEEIRPVDLATPLEEMVVYKAGVPMRVSDLVKMMNLQTGRTDPLWEILSGAMTNQDTQVIKRNRMHSNRKRSELIDRCGLPLGESKQHIESIDAAGIVIGPRGSPAHGAGKPSSIVANAGNQLSSDSGKNNEKTTITEHKGHIVHTKW